MGVRKIMIKRVAVVKFRMDNGCGDDTSCFCDRGKDGYNEVAGFRKC